MPRVIPSIALIAAATILLSGCTSPRAHHDHREERDGGEILTFTEGTTLEAGTVVGIHGDLGEDWNPTAGSTSLGYREWANQELGCSLMLVVVTPDAELPHDLGDRDGSARLAEDYGRSEGRTTSYFYPVVDGGTVQMAMRSIMTAAGGQITLAREFHTLKSAILIQMGCGAGVDLIGVIESLDVTATITE